MNTRTVWLSGVIMVSLMLGSCDREPESTVTLPACVQEIIQTYNLHVDGEPTITSGTFPDNFLTMPGDGIALACKRGGYDLLPYAGQSIVYLSYPIRETWCLDEPLDLYVIMQNTTCLCAYKKVVGGGTASSGGGGIAINKICEH